MLGGTPIPTGLVKRETHAVTGRQERKERMNERRELGLHNSGWKENGEPTGGPGRRREGGSCSEEKGGKI